jgi:pimeloyl-ACP methyl ester carboxylesterase
MSAVAQSLDTGATAIRPFRVNFQEARLVDLRRRINATVWPDKETVSDESEGIQLAMIQKLARYWGTEYDWRRCEAAINAVPNFITEIDGLDIHFIHVRSKHENALPIVITHGWPGSIVEQMKLIEPLTNPTAHGATAADAFHVVIPSMAGYGFSGKPTAPGWDTARMARAWTVLMKRLGYSKFVAQGGDWGSLVSEQMALQAPPELLGIHVNLPFAVPAEILQALPSHHAPPGLDADEQYAFERIDFFLTHGLTYALQMANHPQTLYGMADSPIGLAAWFLEHDLLSYRMIARSFDGEDEGLTPDDVLDNITLTWLTNTAISGARLYRENKLPFFVPLGVKIPVAVSAFPDELYAVPESWAKQAFPRLIYYNKTEKGGHFAAWEQPKIFSEELRAGFKSLRTQ